ncbi:protein of unknown function [Agreia sp. COWG]|nr:protein of unknown function [Agreia sp. COWG]
MAVFCDFYMAYRLPALNQNAFTQLVQTWAQTSEFLSGLLIRLAHAALPEPSWSRCCYATRSKP